MLNIEYNIFLRFLLKINEKIKITKVNNNKRIPAPIFKEYSPFSYFHKIVYFVKKC